MGRRARRAARAPVGRAACPTPDKPSYDAANAAAQVAQGVLRQAPALEAYPCVCGDWHLSRVKPLDHRIRIALQKRP